MVKADAKRDYYADLELSPTAEHEEIKRQFRQLGENSRHTPYSIID
jgi:curved DNA-binding protein CbpA